MGNIKKLFSRYKKGNLSKEEKHIIDSWYEQKEKKFINDVNDEELDALTNDLWKSFSESERRKSVRNQNIRYIFSGGVAAAIILCLFALTHLVINDSRNGNLFYVRSDDPIFEVIESGNSVKKITLSDGSDVYLNKGTSISIHKGGFNSYQRELWLDEGEAFFEIAKYANRPFIVHTADGLSTRVLGTSFNIRAYSELDEQVVSVKTGIVQVDRASGESVVLEPNFKARYNGKHNSIKTGVTDGENVSAWRSGRIVLDHANVKELAFRLKQYYGVNVVNNAIAEDMEIYTSFDNSTPLEHVVSNIEKVFGVKGIIKNNTIYFNK